MKNNAYFDEMYRIGCEWSKRNEAHKARKEEIIEKYGWESDELKAWYAEEERDFQYPISSGACKAYRAWRYSDGDEVIFEDSCWERERFSSGEGRSFWASPGSLPCSAACT